MLQWDCFISHVSDDKKGIVEPLAEKLRAMGLKVWLDNQEIRIGDSLRQKIEQGLADSRFGIVILSPKFLERASFWSQQELNALMAKEEGGHTVILPVWHGITKPELIKVSPILADRQGANSKDGVDSLAANLARVILHPESGSPSAKAPSLVRLTQNLIDSHASGDTMFEFIKDKPQIMDYIAGWDGHIKCAAIQVPGTDYKGFLCWTDGREDASLVVMGPTINPLFESPTIPCPPVRECLQTILSICEHVKANSFRLPDGSKFAQEIVKSKIFGGLSQFYSDCDLQGKEELRKPGISLRTYGMILEAAGMKGEATYAKSNAAAAKSEEPTA
jgi:hypothetical protein